MRTLLLALAVSFCGGFAAAPSAASSLVVREIVARDSAQLFRVSLVVFNARDYRVRIVDNAKPDGSPKFIRLSDAMESLHGLAGCNGGFFTRVPFDPFGLMIVGGRKFGAFDRASWMNGVLVARDGTCALEPSSSFEITPPITEALQSGPWLVRDGRSESSFEQQQIARRTFIGKSSDGRWAIGVCSACTLATLSRVLRNDAVVAAIDLTLALNLDGGPSSGLWAKAGPRNFYEPEGWAVRNFVGVFPITAETK